GASSPPVRLPRCRAPPRRRSGRRTRPRSRTSLSSVCCPRASARQRPCRPAPTRPPSRWRSTSGPAGPSRSPPSTPSPTYQAAVQDEPCLRLLPEGVWPATAMTVGSNTAVVQVALDERAGRIVAIAAIDNLTKGTAGGAVQSANLALGLPEELGLPTNGVA